MTIELVTLLGLGAILFGSILAQSLYTDLTAGISYAFSSRDTPSPSKGIVGYRLDRNVQNQIEGMAVYLPLALIAGVSGVSNAWTEGAALTYLVARGLYPFTYVLGINPVRSIIWTVGFFALPAFMYGLFL